MAGVEAMAGQLGMGATDGEVACLVKFYMADIKVT